MIKNILTFKADADDWEFLALRDTEKTCEDTFMIRDTLRVNFDSQAKGAITLCAIKPELSTPFYRLKPVNMGAARWYSIECDIAGDDLRDADQIIPCLDAASAQTASLFAVLRIFHDDGRSEDISSAELELRRPRKAHSFPIALSDLPELDRSKITSGKVIFFVEARDVSVDIFSLTIAAVAAVETIYTDDHTQRLRALHDSGAESLQMRRLHATMDDLWTGETHEHRALCDDIFLDMEPGEDRRIAVTQDAGRIGLDFTQTASGAWRNLEFRFRDIFNSGSMVAVISAKGQSPLDDGINAKLMVRQYGKNFAWEDVHVPVPFTLFSQDTSEQRVIDLSPLLSDTRHVHHIGLMVFLPRTAQTLELEKMEVFIFDREKI